MRNWWLALGSGLWFASAVNAATLTADDYARAERFLPWNEEQLILNGNIQPHWIGKQERLWYMRTAGVGGAKEFVVVDALTGKSSPAFDHKVIAAGLSEATHTSVDAASLPFTDFRYVKDSAIQVKIEKRLWTCQLKEPVCTGTVAPEEKADEAASPDGRWALALKDFNLWLRSKRGEGDTALTTDGVEHYGYAGPPGVNRHTITDIRHRKPIPPKVLWSPDSRYVLTYRLDERQVKDSYLIQSVPEDGSIRPRLYTYRYALPGEEHVAQTEPVVFDIGSHRQVKLATQPQVVAFDPWIEQHFAWWSHDSKTLYYLEYDRFAKSLSLNAADPVTGKVTEVIKETRHTFLFPGDGRGGAQNAPPSVKVLRNGDVIWYSERDGWGHLYYYDGRTGKLRNQITRGAWIVNDIVRVDEAAHRIFFTAGGREAGRDPYYRHLYSIGMDGSGLTLLTPEDADHQILTTERPLIKFRPETDTVSSAEEKSSFSASGNYLVYSYSRPDAPTVLALRNAAGRLIKELESADISPLKRGGYTPIEPFKAVAADGKTDIYGNIHRPSNFDSNKKYPVVDAIYPGPQIIRTPKDFVAALTDAQGQQALAELGLIVVTIDGRGTPHRSKAFLDDCYGQMGKAGNLEDHIAGIRQLAARYPQMDLDRVGIYGMSGGGYASTHAMLTHPEFYKVAVSAEGNHDQLGYVSAWGETFNGPVGEGNYEDSANPQLAANLKGRLLLMHGDMDDNVSPSLTLRVVDRLIKANRDFDLLIMPNGNHGVAMSPYFIRREWDYFVRNLLGAEPPAGYEIRQPQWAADLMNR